MNKAQITNYILTQLETSGKEYKSPSEKISYNLGFVVSILSELCEKDHSTFVLTKKKLSKLKESGALNKN